MSNHPEDCPCVNCNPTACTDCGMASPGGTHLNERGICRHSRACTGRQMLKSGAPVEAAAAHAQGLDREAGGVAPELTLTKGELRNGESWMPDEWPYDDDPPDPL